MGSASSTPHSWGDSRVVTTVQGQVQGRRLLDKDLQRPVDAFLGIPFAQPPVGHRRFRKPETPSPWEGVRPCSTWAPPSIQTTSWMTRKKEAPRPSEDCLHLNVFTPTWAPSDEFPHGFPVMFFVHGGGFYCGDAVMYGDVGICRRLVTKDIIVVTIQYRVGYLGFWCSDDPLIPPNLGLWDQCAALRWTHDNIAAFGGDKDAITIIGQSAGGVSVDALTLSPHTNCLFRSVVAMSGNAYCDWAFNDREEVMADCHNKARTMGITWSTADELHSKLISAEARHFANVPHAFLDNGLRIAPVLDGDFFPSIVSEMRAAAPPKAMMTGDTFRRIYIADKDLRSKKRMFKGRMELESDELFNAPTLRLVQEQLRINMGSSLPVFLYVFTYCNPRSIGCLRFLIKHKEATHGTEMPYLFATPLVIPMKFDARDERMIDCLTTVFTNFVKYSDPNGPPSSPSQLELSWPRVTEKEAERHLVFNDSLAVLDRFFEGRPATIVEYQNEARRNAENGENGK